MAPNVTPGTDLEALIHEMISTTYRLAPVTGGFRIWAVVGGYYNIISWVLQNQISEIV